METLNKQGFGHMPDGTPVEQVTLRDGALCCEIITYGGAVRSLTVPDRNGQPVDVVLGFDTLEDYRAQDKYMGALVGRYANRIGGSRFTLNGTQYALPANEGANHLHGGPNGFDKQVWAIKDLRENAVTLTLFSPDGQEGYPGSLSIEVTYTLARPALEIEYRARCDRDTLCNPTNHTYFNLSGHASGPVEGQHIQVLAGRYTPVAEGSIPTGAVAPVDGTPMDLRTPQPIGAHVNDPFDQLLLTGGYDHNWAIDGWDGTLRPAARVWSPDTGIRLEVQTTLPGIQFYAGNFVEGCPAGKNGAVYGRRGGFCLESQYYPDSPNQPSFPSAVLSAGAEYRSRTVFQFDTANAMS